jgi:hypothetical protein
MTVQALERLLLNSPSVDAGLMHRAAGAHAALPGSLTLVYDRTPNARRFA